MPPSFLRCGPSIPPLPASSCDLQVGSPLTLYLNPSAIFPSFFPLTCVVRCTSPELSAFSLCCAFSTGDAVQELGGRRESTHEIWTKRSKYAKLGVESNMSRQHPPWRVESKVGNRKGAPQVASPRIGNNSWRAWRVSWKPSQWSASV